MIAAIGRLAARPRHLAARRRTAAQASVYVVTTGFTSLLSAVCTAIAARHMSVDAFGAFTFSIAFLSFVALFFEFGYFVPAARRLAMTEGDTSRQIVGAAFLLYV